MLAEWIAPMAREEFARMFLRRQPWAGAGTALTSCGGLGWASVDDVLAHPSCDALVVAHNEVLKRRPPRSLAELRALMRSGVGVVLRKTERCLPALADLARKFAVDVPGDVHVQIFATPGHTHGFGWHFDREEIFIAQLAGVKEYYFRPNTLGAADANGLAFADYNRETSPMGASTLVAGDCLYIPSRWWHVALCVEDALSISVGVTMR